MSEVASEDKDWDEVSFVISSDYRTAVLQRLAASPTTPSSIKDDTDVDLSHVSRALSRLQERSLVELLVSEDRKKGRVYGVTERGSKVFEKIEQMNGGGDCPICSNGDGA